MEDLEVLKQFGITSLEEAREFAGLTDRIVANLKFIDESNVNLNDMAEQTSNIVANLRVIEEQR
jgi:3-keto-L-gulonate-6-phosphate decarboxylase